MQSESRIALFSLDTGEIGEIKGRLPDNKFIARGHKLYSNRLLDMVEFLTKDEMKQTISLFDNEHIDCNNICTDSFLRITKDMSKEARSRLKRKLIDNMILQEYMGKIMLNPYIFIPRGDLNVRNSKHLTQRVWRWLFQDKDAVSDEIAKHTERLFGRKNKKENR